MTRSRHETVWLYVLVLVGGSFASHLEAQDANDEPSVAGRPPDFSQVVGRYRISATVDRTDVIVEDPITLTVRIVGQGPKQFQPVRKLLRIFSEDLAENFYLEPVPDQDRVLPRVSTWEFVYRLRPRTTQVQFIPGPRLICYSPERRAYQTTYADDISLTVRTRAEKKLSDLGLAVVQAPERLYHLETGNAVLAKEELRSYWTPGVLVTMLLGPPLISWIGFLLWRRLCPDHVRASLRRRSLAARHAMRELAQVQSYNAPGTVVAILTGYLRERLDFSAAEPTPAEVVLFLRRRGVSAAVRQRWGDFLCTCDEARFGGGIRTGLETRPTGIRML